MLYGDIVIFGRDDTTKRKGAPRSSAVCSDGRPARLVAINKEEKAVVGINLRLVDTETGEVIETAEARGESSRSSKDYAGALGVAGAGAWAGAGGVSMTSSNFQQTIIGEATSNAVTKIVEFLETRVPQLPAKPRAIEGRVAVIGGGQATLAVGSNDGVLRGDRFEILQINGEIRDPATKEVIDVDAVKIGELVVDTVRDRTATGAYGGQPLSTAVHDRGRQGLRRASDAVGPGRETGLGHGPAPVPQRRSVVPASGRSICCGLFSSWRVLPSSSNRRRSSRRSGGCRLRVLRLPSAPTSTA